MAIFLGGPDSSISHRLVLLTGRISISDALVGPEVAVVEALGAKVAMLSLERIDF